MGLEKIAEYKKKMGMTTAELAEKSGVPLGTLNKILSGATKDPKLETLKAIARVLGLTLNDFDDYEDKNDITACIEPTYNDMQQLIARNGNKLTTDEKMLLIKLLSEF
ncbi:helix-turn-helix transcriptional regulator [uncultured Robinsoniella sp.]|uniref:helix-turn-helix transcriptional regulator n=1 Tax=uncultured Robinsoniella sp. TaxID=904190 RepID=UPI0020452883|nr:MAG TPA: helix-turn-helix domain protein [Caudoviricetes sp.]